MTVIYADADGEITLLRLVMTRASAVVSSEPSFFASEVALHRLASPEPEAEELRGLPTTPDVIQRLLQPNAERGRLDEPLSLAIVLCNVPIPVPIQCVRLKKHRQKCVRDQNQTLSVTPALVHTMLAPDLQALEPILTRYGYNVAALAELLNIRQAEVRAFLHGQLPPGRTEALHNHLLAAEIPLGDHVSSAHSELATG
jgi:hypothetical protein